MAQIAPCTEIILYLYVAKTVSQSIKDALVVSKKLSMLWEKQRKI